MNATQLEALAHQIGPIVREYVARVVGAYAKRLEDLEARQALPGPVGERGVPGEPGARGEKGVDGVSGKDGRDGLPGVPGAQGERGEKGLDGAPGAHGRDGTLEHLQVDYDGERTIRLCRLDGTLIKGGVIVLPIVIDRGVYQEGRVYEKGDGVTYSSSFWIAQGPTEAKPKESSEASRAWRLAVKQGAPGKSGPPGAKGLDGTDGRPGRDLTQMDAQGHKW